MYIMSKLFFAWLVLCNINFAGNARSISDNNIVYETEDKYTVTLLYDFDGSIKSRRFENLRSKSRLDALDQIAAHIYINTVYDIKTSELAHPSVFVDAVAVLKPFKVRAKVSQLKSIYFSRVSPK